MGIKLFYYYYFSKLCRLVFWFCEALELGTGFPGSLVLSQSDFGTL